jgi:hypothetical protein
MTEQIVIVDGEYSDDEVDYTEEIEDFVVTMNELVNKKETLETNYAALKYKYSQLQEKHTETQNANMMLKTTLFELENKHQDTVYVMFISHIVLFMIVRFYL